MSVRQPKRKNLLYIRKKLLYKNRTQKRAVFSYCSNGKDGDLLVLQVEESLLAQELCNILAQLFLDAEQLIVLCNAVSTRRSTGLDLASVQCNSDISDGCVLGLTGTVGYTKTWVISFPRSPQPM